MIIEELRDLFIKNGIKKGDILCIHSDVTSFGIPPSLKDLVRKNGVNFLMDSYIDTFKAVVRENGLILMPTFTYSTTKGEIFDVENTKSTVGALTEYFRKKEGVIRSLHPVFSYAAWGKDAKKFLKLDSYDCFGKKSFFNKLYEVNAIQLMFGLNIQDGLTFVYYSEEKANVYYRYNKTFHSIIKDKEDQFEVEVTYFVRDYNVKYEDYWYDLQKVALERGIAKLFKYGMGKIIITKSQEIDKLIQEELKKNKDFLIKKC